MTIIGKTYIPDGEVEGLGYSVVAILPDHDRYNSVDVDLTPEQLAAASDAYTVCMAKVTEAIARMETLRIDIAGACTAYREATQWLPPVYRAAYDAQREHTENGGA